MKNNSFKLQIISALIVFWGLLALIFGYISYSVADAENRASFPYVIFSLNFIKFFLWLAFLPLIFKVVKGFGFEKGGNFLFNLLALSGFCFLFVVLHTFIYTPFVAFIDPLIDETLPTISTLFEKYLFFGNFFLGILLCSLLAVLVQMYLLFEKNQNEQNKVLKLESQLAEARLQSLKMQLHPHFLFNTLHSISSLNLSNPKKANAMIRRLGDFLRMTLERSNEQMVTINEELEFLRCYLEIEQIRFSDRLTVEFDVPDRLLSQQVPHLILQPIVENALKHGIAPHAAKSKIIISAEENEGNLLLKIEDETDHQKKSFSNNVNGKGLTNVRLRLEHLYGENSNLSLTETESGLIAQLKIPYSAEEN